MIEYYSEISLGSGHVHDTFSLLVHKPALLLLYFGLFNIPVRTSDCVSSKDRIISEYEIRKDLEGSS
jgi:hypothetical protein